MSNQPPTQRVVFFPKAHEELYKGATVLANAVASTMGPSGHSVIIDMETGPPLITKDGVTVAKSINLKDKLQSMGAELLKEVASKTNDIAGDGPQPLYSKVLTPNGWKMMGEIKAGDIICGTENTTQKVLGVYDKGNKNIYKITLSDGNTATRFVECSEEHLWSITSAKGTQKLMTTKEILDSGLKKTGGGSKWFIKPTSVEFTNSEDLPLDPYLLGVLLGDGSLSKNGDIEIAVGLKEEYILDQLKLPGGCKLRKRHYTDKKHYIRATITGNNRKGKVRFSKTSIVKNILDNLGLLGMDSYTKFIPKTYLYSSIQNRRLLLEGLIDTDGYVNNRGLFEFSTVSKQLYTDFIELCRSLGKCVYGQEKTRKENDGSYGKNKIYRVCELKGNKFGLKIKNIEKLNKQTKMMCIKVSNSDHLYITDNYVPTHNTTTATVLGHAIFTEGLKMISTGRSAIDIKKGMDNAADIVIKFLRQNSIPLSSREDIVNVGTISANGDRSIGDLLATAIERVGNDGIITVEPAKSVETTLDIVEGMQLDTGYVSPFFITNSERATCELENPYVLMTPNKISSIQDIIGLLEGVLKTSRPLLIIADDVEGEALHTLIVNKTKGVVKVCAIKAPSYGEHRADILSDIQTLTGGLVFNATTDLTLKKASINHLGSAKKVIIGRNTTTIISDLDDERKTALEDRIRALRTSLTEDKTLDALHIDKYRKRLARLSGGVAVIKVGGSTEVEILEKKDRVEDAVNATLAATQEGIVPGGGVALYYAANHLREQIALKQSIDISQDEMAGMEIIANVCEYPLNTIVSNTGASPDVVKQRLKTSLTGHKVFYVDTENADVEDLVAAVRQFKAKTDTKKDDRRFGYNAAKGTYGDLVAEGIIDPVKVTRYALEHAVSVIGLTLACNSVIVNEEEN